MKFKLFTILFVCLVACKSQSHLSTQVKEPIIQKAGTSIEGYESTISLIPNKSLEFKTDKFNSVYVEENEGPNFILKYEIKRIQDEKLPDGRYREVVYAELPADFKDMTLYDGQLLTLKVHAARFCFCENGNSYEPITTGVFQIIENKKNELRLRLDFKPKKSPFKITSISEVLYLN